MKSLLFVAAFMPYSIRNRLTALKKDRGEYIKPADVNSLYQAMIKQGMPALYGLISGPVFLVSSG
jgi:hypothetical protein